MKHLIIFGIVLLITTNLSAQFRNLTIVKSDVPALKIIQVDFREFSTLFHFQYTAKAGGWACVDENFYIKDKETFKKYKLLNSINLPICDKKHVLDQEHPYQNFTLEFEKLPESIGEFDIIENPEGGFNFYGVKIDTTIKAKDYLDIASFIDETPVKEYSFYYKDGQPVLCYKHKGLFIAVLLSYDNTYGKYYQANILVQNLTGKDINFDPSQITSKIQKKEEISEAKVLTYNEYIKKVKSRQAWSSFAVAFSESMAASNAGYSSSTTQSSAHGYSNSYGSASGYVGNTYGSVYGSSSTYSSAYGTSSTQKYDGAAAYSAQQNANNNVANYQNQQYKIKSSISEGYMKLNTIMNESEYVGYVNIAYTKADNLQLYIPINGTTYLFVW